MQVRLKNSDYIESYLEGIRKIEADISREDIDKVIEILFNAWRHGARVFICGNGGSAATATHFACDLNKVTVRPGKKRMKVTSLVDNVPLVSALTNDDGWENIYTEQLTNFFEPGDVVIGISVHGGKGKDKAGTWSQNLLKALQFAKDHGGYAVGLAGFDGGAMKEMSDACIVVPYNTTPHVEAWHVVLHHLIAFCLGDKIESDADGSTP
jgi:D-sedoheptulose 7-phosphate isomerase